jgi:predicted dehydrogenase
LFTECIGAKCTTIFLEKPGAPTVKELSGMRDEAKKAGVGVLMGYNKVRA